MMKSIEEYSGYLLNCCFTDESFDPEDHEDHLKVSWELFENYPWENIYPVWRRHLHEKCPTPADVINFVNLYIYYDAGNKEIPDPLGFVSYLYYRVDMDLYWDEAGELFEGLTINILSKHGLINMIEEPYYNPLEDERIRSRVCRLKKIGKEDLNIETQEAIEEVQRMKTDSKLGKRYNDVDVMMKDLLL